MFAANYNVGSELWQTDNTVLGTALIADIYPPEGDSNPALHSGVGGRLLFRASDGTHGAELW